MQINKDKLITLITGATCHCSSCPLYEGGEMECFCENCTQKVLDWLQEFSVAEVLEEGGHIVNDKAIFPPEEIPYKPVYDVPCEQVGRPCNVNCPYYWEGCPYE